MKKTNVRRAVPEQAYGYPVALLVVVTQRQACGDGLMCAEDCMASPKILLNIRHMH